MLLAGQAWLLPHTGISICGISGPAPEHRLSGQGNSRSVARGDAVVLKSNYNLKNTPPSLHFSKGYIYPENIGDGGICDSYNGVPCSVDSSQCCYNQEMWCPEGVPHCARYDRAAYPFGDEHATSGEMTSALALSPYPNAIMWNWATILILAFGNIAALDFQARCLPSQTSRVATLGCLIGGCITLIVGIPFSYLGSITR